MKYSFQDKGRAIWVASDVIWFVQHTKHIYEIDELGIQILYS